MSKGRYYPYKSDVYMLVGREGHRSLIRDIEMIRSMDLPEGSSLYLIQKK